MTDNADGKRTKQGRARSLALRCYTLGRTAQGRPYAGRGDASYFLDSKGTEREALRADLRDAWEGDAECLGDPPSDTILNGVIADMRRAAGNCEPDLATPAEVAADLVGVLPWDALDEHPDRFKAYASGRNPFDIAREVADYLLKANDPPCLFVMGPAAGVLLREDGTLDALDQDGWLAYVAERVDFLYRTNDGDRLVAPPATVMRIVATLILRELPHLDGVTSTPYLDADGNLITRDGYNPGTRLCLRMDGLMLPPVSDSPSPQEVAAAAGLLMDDWLADFPFASPADKANAVAELLTITGREMFPLAPMFVHDASTAGSGKGLLLNTISIIATGEPAEVMELPSDGEEQRKTITSVLLAGKLLVAWDELHVITGKTLAAILTAQIYTGRILSTNKLVTVRNKLVQIALGNNVEARGDMRRRVVPCRLIPDTDHPEHRTGFRHPKLELWAARHRGELLAAAFTLWRHWLAAGRPEADVTMGSYEQWARITGGVLHAAGIHGFGTNTADWLSYSEDDDGWPSHLASLCRYFASRWFTVSAAADAVNAGYVKRPPMKRDPDKELASQIAYVYRSNRDRWHRDLRLIRSRERDSEHGAYTWKICQRGTADSSPVSPGCPEPQVKDQEANGDKAGSTGDTQDAGPHLQETPTGRTAGHEPFTGDTGHPGDESGHSPAAPAQKTSASPLRWRSDGTPAIGDADEPP